MQVCPSFCRLPFPKASVPSFTLPIYAVLSQNFTNKNSLVCIDSEKYAFLVTLRPWGKAKLRIIKITSVFLHLNSISPQQLCAIAHLQYNCKAGTSQSRQKQKMFLDVRIIKNFNFFHLTICRGNLKQNHKNFRQDHQKTFSKFLEETL